MSVKFDAILGKLRVADTSGLQAISGLQSTEAAILASTPTLGNVAWATDLAQLLIADGTNWWVLSAYLAKDLEAPDMGSVQGSNRSGYGSSYVTDKTLANCRLGDNANTTAGSVRYNPIGGTSSTPVMQAYYSGAWKNIVAGFVFNEVAGVFEYTPVSYALQIAMFSGDSDILGLNGLPLIQGYKVSIGAYPVQQIVYGGTF